MVLPVDEDIAVVSLFLLDSLFLSTVFFFDHVCESLFGSPQSYRDLLIRVIPFPFCFALSDCFFYRIRGEDLSFASCDALSRYLSDYLCSFCSDRYQFRYSLLHSVCFFFSGFYLRMLLSKRYLERKSSLRSRCCFDGSRYRNQHDGRVSVSVILISSVIEI